MTDIAKDFNYQAEAQMTKSDQFHGELVSRNLLLNTIAAVIGHLNTLDKIKKSLFYGKVNHGLMPITNYDRDCQEIMYKISDNGESSIDIIHCIIGKATESGELLEALYSSISGGLAFDIINFKEEIGDGKWYDAIGLAAVKATSEEIERTNIAKLRARFPNKFTEYDANNRNLDAERTILEG
jgi:hypothetical protein